MKAFTFFALFTLTAFALLNIAPPVVDAHQKQVNAERYAQQQVDRDARMQRACDAHQLGVVLYYKGKDCAQ